MDGNRTETTLDSHHFYDTKEELIEAINLML